MAEENEYGIFADMHLEEIIETLFGEGLWMRLNHSIKGNKTRWMFRVKIARPEGMPRAEYTNKTPDICLYDHCDLMTAAREAACKAFYGEPEIDLGLKDEQ